MPPDSPARPHLLVAAAVIERDGAFLLARRLEGTHLAGQWEFPGGKCHDVETLEACLARELREELDVESEVGREILATVHHYPDRSVELRFFRCRLLGEPNPVLGQELRWVTRADLPTLLLPPADHELVRMLAGEEPWVHF
ncbi:MAG: (deoxy)nucleoside triphosphate pyrophosphohydrolase [Acidobacteriota bacterium]